MKAEDKIEKLIRNNLDGLNDHEPRSGHFERFEAKLKGEQKTKRITFGTVWKVAAAVVFILLATNQAVLYLKPDPQVATLAETKNTDNISLATVSPEYREVEFYFTNAINVGLNEWNSLEKEGFVSENEQQLMNSELAEFESRFKTLQADLAANPNDERVINAMLEYYQTKLGIINLIVGKLEEVKKQKNNHHETDI